MGNHQSFPLNLTGRPRECKVILYSLATASCLGRCLIESNAELFAAAGKIGSLLLTLKWGGFLTN